MQTDIPTVSEVVRRAAALCDPDGHDAAATALVVRFEDAEEPARGLPGLKERLLRAVDEVDPEGDSPAAAMAAAVAFYLSGAPEHADDREGTLRVAARLVFGEDPPERVAAWLADHGVQT